MPDGQRFKDIDEFKKILLDDPDQIARCVAEKLLIYATGTTIRPADQRRGRDRQGGPRNYGLRTLVHEIVQSELFLNKWSRPEPSTPYSGRLLKKCR